MGLLTPEPGLIFWMIIIFGVVFFLLAKYGFPVIIKMVDDRKAYIDNSLKAAREANEKLANIQAESERKPMKNWRTSRPKANASWPRHRRSSHAS